MKYCFPNIWIPFLTSGDYFWLYHQYIIPDLLFMATEPKHL